MSAQEIHRGSEGRVIAVAAAAGVVTGLASTFPWELGPVTSLTAWALVGLHSD